MLPGFTAPRLAVLSVLIYFAGVVDALAGGGGLITLPAYLAAGLDPALLLGTNKLASGIGTIEGVYLTWASIDGVATVRLDGGLARAHYRRAAPLAASVGPLPP